MSLSEKLLLALGLWLAILAIGRWVWKKPTKEQDDQDDIHWL